ncbi:hypothetical protein SAMN04487910_0036 [Aquimarina amphilecti]|uniref:Uncharacterized protein n=1 Tax=Aquimarina amphilecti TaxID=1038014 RepID=A0A1H7FBW4_AQUAM|nr:hypothetical protein [Aquimarina amphilecti]SEK23551.1 hypothetical protein SAMN04487910_0036 [Aquimarina amphilecti]
MTKLLRPALLFVFVLCSFNIQAQEDILKETIIQFNSDMTTFDFSIPHENEITHDKKVFSYECVFENANHNHANHEVLHSEDIALIDIITSDEGTDFNCSGGFCMDKSHFHKKGLTLKRQLFDYFMKISC